jgi:hypothetical protein
VFRPCRPPGGVRPDDYRRELPFPLKRDIPADFRQITKPPC